jgi:hypothetical protein
MINDSCTSGLSHEVLVEVELGHSPGRPKKILNPIKDCKSAQRVKWGPCVRMWIGGLSGGSDDWITTKKSHDLGRVRNKKREPADLQVLYNVVLKFVASRVMELGNEGGRSLSIEHEPKVCLNVVDHWVNSGLRSM